jgi:alkylation response protein AidB-like acyl-CoA dehydrogenase
MGGIISPKEFGGMALSHLTYVCILEELAKGCLTTTAILSVHHLVQFFLKRFGTQNQQQKFLPPLAKGEYLGAICITEPDAGSDVASIKTIAKRTGNHYSISGVKNFITNAGEADVYIVLAKTDRGLNAFIVEKAVPGISFGERDEKMGYRGSSTREVFFDETTVHADQLIGGTEGRGFEYAMKGLNFGRIGIGTISVGLAQAALGEVIKHFQSLSQSKNLNYSVEVIRFLVAELTTEIEAARLLCYQAASKCGQGKDFSLEASMAKQFASDVAVRSTREAVQILGPYGYLGDYRVERYMREAKMLQIVEGTNEVQRIIISKELMKKTVL